MNAERAPALEERPGRLIAPDLQTPGTNVGGGPGRARRGRKERREDQGAESGYGRPWLRRRQSGHGVFGLP